MHFPGKTVLRRARSLLSARVQLRRNRSIAERYKNDILLFVFDSEVHGLFAHIAQCIVFANWAKVLGRKVGFACLGGVYRAEGEAENWLPEILIQKKCHVPRTRAELERPNVIRLSSSFLAFPHWQYGVKIPTLPVARELFYETFEVAPSIKRELFAELDRWNGYFVVGMHYRGTDKTSEARRVGYDEAIARAEEVVEEIGRHGVEKVRVFVATDEAEFLRRMKAVFGDAVLSRAAVRSDNGAPVHIRGGPATGNRLAADAMIDALLLAQCPVLIKTASFLSGISAMLARDQVVFMLNPPYSHTLWFPESEVVTRAADFKDAASVIRALLLQSDRVGRYSPE